MPLLVEKRRLAKEQRSERQDEPKRNCSRAAANMTQEFQQLSNAYTPRCHPMKRMSALLLLSVLPGVLVAQPNRNPRQRVLVFTHVTIIDATGSPAKPDMTVVIIGGRINALGKAGKIPVPIGAQVVDASSKFLIPGLWDMHVHTSYKIFLSLFIANGITSVRDMGVSPDGFEQLQQWRKQIADATLVGPRIIAAGITVDGPNGRPKSLNVATESDARQAVISLKQRGVDFVKVYSMLSREAYFGIADEAKRQGLTFAGHIPASVSAAEASEAGQKSIEHLVGVFAACASNEAELLSEARKAIAKSGFAAFSRAEVQAEVKSLDTYDDEKAAALFARFVKNGTWQVPTIVGFGGVLITDESFFTSDPRLKYIPVETREAWKAQRPNLLKSLPPEFLANRQRLFQKQLDLTGAMHRAGVELMAGTDSVGLYVFPGFSLHDELGLLVKAGLTPMEALQAATRDPARYFGRLDSLGTVEKGKIADLVLLEANPLEEISNTKKIAAVVLGGKLLLKSELEEMLAEVEAAASKK